jgi:hypothetical protein
MNSDSYMASSHKDSYPVQQKQSQISLTISEVPSLISSHQKVFVPKMSATSNDLSGMTPRALTPRGKRDSK